MRKSMPEHTENTHEHQPAHTTAGRQLLINSVVSRVAFPRLQRPHVCCSRLSNWYTPPWWLPLQEAILITCCHVCVFVLYKLFSRGIQSSLQLVRRRASPPSLSVCSLTCRLTVYLSFSLLFFSVCSSSFHLLSPNHNCQYELPKGLILSRTHSHTHTHTHTQTHRLALMITDQRLFGWTGNMFYFKVQFRGLFSLCIDNMMGNYYYMSYHVVPL